MFSLFSIISLSILPAFLCSNITNVTDVFYSNCQNSKSYGCFTSSDKIGNCSITKTCDFGITWIGESEHSYKIQLISKTGKDVFSEIKDEQKLRCTGLSFQFGSAVYYH